MKAGPGTHFSALYEAIGIIYSSHSDPAATPVQPVYAGGCRGRAVLFPEYAGGLKDLDGFSHIYLVYHFHRASSVRLHLRPFLDDRDRGVFSTRSPERPNHLGISIVRLIAVEDNVLHLEGIDVLDGTPLLDIKPYVARFDRRDDTRDGWLASVEEALARERGARGYYPVKSSENRKE